MKKFFKKIAASHQYQRTRKNFYDFRWLIYIYLVGWVIFLIFFVAKIDQTQCFFDRNFGNGFTQNFASSFLWDMIAFLFLGFLATFISATISKKNPEDYTFYERISALVNNEKIERDKSLVSYLTSHISKLLVCNTQSTLNINVLNYDPDVGAYQLYIKMEYTITNMCRDNPYIESEFYSTVFADYKIDGKPNFITADYIHDTETKEIVAENVNDYKPFELEYRDCLNIDIPENSSVGYKLWFCIWNKCCGDENDLDEWLSIFLPRYAYKYDVVINNSLPNGDNFYVNCKVKRNIFDNNDEEERLEQNKLLVRNKKSVTFVTKKELLPLETIYFYFNKES